MRMPASTCCSGCSTLGSFSGEKSSARQVRTTADAVMVSQKLVNPAVQGLNM